MTAGGSTVWLSRLTRLGTTVTWLTLGIHPTVSTGPRSPTHPGRYATRARCMCTEASSSLQQATRCVFSTSLLLPPCYRQLTSLPGRSYRYSLVLVVRPRFLWAISITAIIAVDSDARVCCAEQVLSRWRGGECSGGRAVPTQGCMAGRRCVEAAPQPVAVCSSSSSSSSRRRRRV
jgi:hypothetical protein